VATATLRVKPPPQSIICEKGEEKKPKNKYDLPATCYMFRCRDKTVFPFRRIEFSTTGVKYIR